MRAQVAANPSTPDNRTLVLIRFVHGGHSCAREEDNWTDIAKFIVAEVPQQEPKPIGGSNSE
jgi:hypothetical protein